MVVVSVNGETGDVLMFSFPRDIARFPLYNGGTFHGKLNTFAGVSKLYPEQFPDPGMPSLAYEVGYLLGVPIDYYASVNMVGFMDIVRQVGGVTINNEKEIADDTLQFYLSEGEHRLGPEDALRYVRSRHGAAGGDFARARRQQQVLAALRKEMLKPENLIRVGDIAESLAGVINTNFPTDQIDQLVDLANRVEAEPSASWVFRFPEWADHLKRDATCGRSIIFLRMDRIAALSIEQFGEKSLWFGQTPPPPPQPEPCG
jgi:LCP family protein required for cell wall assembly